MKKMNDNSNTNATTNTFQSLCKELGQKVRTSETENALLCYRAYQAYLKEYPDTGRGKGKKKDRNASSPPFAVKAAEISGVSRSTIDALLQIGRAIQPLSASAKRDLVSSSLRNSKNVLRKLATKDFDSKRESLITTFAKEDMADPKSAMQRLKKKLGMTPSQRTGVVAESVFDPKSYHLAQGESFELPVGRYVFRVEIKEHTSGRTHVTAVAFKGERKEQHTFLGAKKPSRAAKKKGVAAKASPKGDIAEAAE